MTYILGISGSPVENGNTDKLVKAIMKELGTKRKFIALRDLKLKQCNGCDKCQETKKCVIRDGMKTLEVELLKADTIVLGSPCYFDNVSGLMKNFMDRTNYLYQKLSLRGKNVIAGASGEASKDSIQGTITAMEKFARAHQMIFIGGVGVLKKKGEDVLKNPLVLERIKAVCKTRN
ncbi:MAG: flavodoxin family protein [archaeon]